MDRVFHAALAPAGSSASEMLASANMDSLLPVAASNTSHAIGIFNDIQYILFD